MNDISIKLGLFMDFFSCPLSRSQKIIAYNCTFVWSCNGDQPHKPPPKPDYIYGLNPLHTPLHKLLCCHFGEGSGRRWGGVIRDAFSVFPTRERDWRAIYTVMVGCGCGCDHG